MSRRFFGFIFIALVLGLSACTQFESLSDELILSEQPLWTAEQTYEEGMTSLIESTEHYILSVHYPLTGFSFIDLEIEEFITSRIELYNQEVAEYGGKQEDKWPFELHIAFDIPYKSSSHTSIVFTETKILMSPQPVTQVFTYTYSMSTKTKLRIKDVFDDNIPYLVTLSQLCYDELMRDERLTAYLDLPLLKNGLLPIERNFSLFTLSQDELTIYFERNQIAPSFIGIPKATIPLESLKAHVTLKELTAPPHVSRLSSRPPTETKDVAIVDDRDIPSADPNAINSDANVSVKSKRIALTFEGGPHPIYTPMILDALKQYQAKATFFVLGQRASYYSPLVLRMFYESHELGNHSYDYPQFIRLSQEEMTEQIEKTQSILHDILKTESHLFRPPYGAFNQNIIDTANMPIILWSIDPQDTLYLDPDYIVSFIMDHAYDGAIIRLHDTLPSTTQAIGPLLDSLNKAGYQLVTVSELLGLSEDISRHSNRTYTRAIYQ